MMSQNRQETRDRKRSEEDYKINLKAELELRQLHQKVDHLLVQQWESADDQGEQEQARVREQVRAGQIRAAPPRPASQNGM